MEYNETVILLIITIDKTPNKTPDLPGHSKNLTFQGTKLFMRLLDHAYVVCQLYRYLSRTEH
jgi:hypothetical protein